MKKLSVAFIAVVIIFEAGWVVWMLTGPVAQINVPILYPITPSFADTKLASMSLKQKISSLLILHVPGTDSTVLGNYLKQYQPGGLIFMGDNIPGNSIDLKLLTSQLQTNKSMPYLFAVDEEGGIVHRLPSDTLLSAMDLKNQPLNATTSAFKDRSTLLYNSGLNLNFGIIADVTADSNSFIYQRVFGGDTELVGARVAAAVKASKGFTLSTLKHFPGHGETEADSHLTIPTTSVTLAEWQSKDKLPFQMGVDAGADVVMFGHLRYSSVDDLPASLSAKWHEILKNQLGFNGITITDDMSMLQDSGETQFSDPVNNAVAAFSAGNTMLLYVLGADDSVAGVSTSDLIDGIIVAVNDGRLKLDDINKDVKIVISVKLSLLNNKPPTLINGIINP